MPLPLRCGITLAADVPQYFFKKKPRERGKKDAKGEREEEEKEETMKD